MATKKAPKKRSGRPVNVYLGEPDLQRVRKLAGWLSMQGHRASDSQAIKAALIATKPDADYLRAFQKVKESDLRFHKQ
jgi:hypothetical protein